MSQIVLLVAGLVVLLLGGVSARNLWASFQQVPKDPVEKMFFELLQAIACLLMAFFISALGYALAQVFR